jgi:hypothetical protein
MESISFYYVHIILNSVKYIMYLTLGYSILCILLNCASFFFGYFDLDFTLASYLLPHATSASDGAGTGYVSGHEPLDITPPQNIQGEEISDPIYERETAELDKAFEDTVEWIKQDSSKSDQDKAMECEVLRAEYQYTIDVEKRDVLHRAAG